MCMGRGIHKCEDRLGWREREACVLEKEKKKECLDQPKERKERNKERVGLQAGPN